MTSHVFGTLILTLAVTLFGMEVYDHFKTSLNKETIVHIWKDVTNVTEVFKYYA